MLYIEKMFILEVLNWYNHWNLI